MTTLLKLCLFIITISTQLRASPLSHAPIGVMGDHTHHQGELMLSLRYMRGEMDGVQTGTQKLSHSDYPQNIKPQDMTMQMAMLGAMYGLSSRVTLMAMLPYKKIEMSLSNSMNSAMFSTESLGLGDIQIASLVNLISHDKITWLANLGLALPTGDIRSRDSIPMMGEVQLPYPMQLGSGSVSFQAGSTLKYRFGENRVGLQAKYRFFVNDNSLDYKMGDELETNLWVSLSLLDWMHGSLRLNHKWRNDIIGRDSSLMISPQMNPAADPKNWGGSKTSIFLGGQFQVSENQNIGLEIGVPVSQNLHGPQMRSQFVGVLGWQYKL